MRLAMTQTEADALAARFIHFLETGEADPELFSAGVFCDFTLPRWRLAAAPRRAPGREPAHRHALLLRAPQALTRTAAPDRRSAARPAKERSD
jgi:hypothetical protein